MGQTTQQIEAHIEHTRENLGSNLNELEHKVKSVTDWKQHFRTNPMTMMGIAFGGGILLSTMLGGRKYRRGDRSFSTHGSSSEPHAGTDRRKHKAMETWDNIKGALIGVAATRFKDFVGEVVPGFHEQFHRTEEKARAIQSAMR
jgi:Protein of unknown function (DUF3618)